MRASERRVDLDRVMPGDRGQRTISLLAPIWKGVSDAAIIGLGW